MSNKILCLEGEKSSSPHEKQSVQTILECIQASSGISFEHHRIATRTELEHRLSMFGRSKTYSMLYLGFRASAGKFELAREQFTLEELAELSEGRWDNRLLHLGCGNILKIPPKQIEALRRATGVSILSGYAGPLSFFPTLILEMSFLEILNTYRTPAAIAKHLGEQQKFWVKELVFKMSA